jgi:hypothetical protein
MGYGSSSLSALLTACTQVVNGMSTISSLTAVTSSGVYFAVGDMSRMIIMVMNCTPEATGITDLYLQRSSYYTRVQGGDYTSQGRAVGTVNITGTAPGANACATHANISTSVNITFIGPLDSREYKTSLNNVFLFTSSKQTSNQFVYATVYSFIGGSTA